MRNLLLLSSLVAAALPVHAQRNSVPVVPGWTIQTSSCRFIGRPVSERALAVSAYFDAKYKAQMAASFLALYENPAFAATPDKVEEAREYASTSAAKRDAARTKAIELGGMRDAAPKDEDYACSLVRGVDYFPVPSGR